MKADGPPTCSVAVNGVAREVHSGPWTRLLDVLREELALTGTKEGCGEGECGACTVLLDGVPVNSCLVAIGQCGGRTVTTVEGLATKAAAAAPVPGADPAAQAKASAAPSAVDESMLNAVQRELVRRGGAQCGICTPGIAVCATYLVGLGLASAPDEEARVMVRQFLAGNICRCTGYQLIVDAVIAAAREAA
ncbi:MAG TPA: 2Fe-2S iron-sulfur cluster-binding protein [Kofleriaceae bacterium]|nr:2Fe-2S iron-sulfur cluster-binding protein [Kofleriaceae bacterium]